jgi:hypothetical protein
LFPFDRVSKDFDGGEIGHQTGLNCKALRALQIVADVFAVTIGRPVRTTANVAAEFPLRQIFAAGSWRA